MKHKEYQHGHPPFGEKTSSEAETEPVVVAASADQEPDAPGLEDKLREAEQKAGEHYDAWLRAKAETENARRRAQEEVSKASRFAIEKFAGEMLAVKDSLEAAFAHAEPSVENMRAGLEVTLKQMQSALERSGVKEVNPQGEKFDPNWHQAISVVPHESEANTVVHVMQKGYQISDRVLRPAMVIVSAPKNSD